MLLFLQSCLELYGSGKDNGQQVLLLFYRQDDLSQSFLLYLVRGTLAELLTQRD